MENVHGFGDINNNNNNCDDIICPISGQLVVIPAILEDGEIYDFFSILKYRYDDAEGVNLNSPVTGNMCERDCIFVYTLFKLINNNDKNKSKRIEIAKNFKFSQNSLLKGVEFICNISMKEFIIEYYGEPNYWDVTEVYNVVNLFTPFKGSEHFNYDISSWNLNNVQSYTDEYGVYKTGFEDMCTGNVGMRSNFVKGLTDEQYEVILKTGFEDNEFMQFHIRGLMSIKPQYNISSNTRLANAKRHAEAAIRRQKEQLLQEKKGSFASNKDKKENSIKNSFKNIKTVLSPFKKK